MQKSTNKKNDKFDNGFTVMEFKDAKRDEMKRFKKYDAIASSLASSHKFVIEIYKMTLTIEVHEMRRHVQFFFFFFLRNLLSCTEPVRWKNSIL